MRRAFNELEKKLDAIEELAEREILYNNVSALREANKEIDDFYRKYANKEGQVEVSEFRKFNRGNKLKNRLSKVLYKATKQDREFTRLMLRNIYKDTYRATVGIANDELEKRKKKTVNAVAKDFKATRSINKEIEGLTWANRANRNRNKAIQTINKKVVKGIEQGKLYHEVSNELVETLDINYNQAKRIARTESHRVKSDAKQDAFEDLDKAGVEAVKEWVSSRDEKVRSSHKSMDGQQVGLDEDFISPKGNTGKSPGNLGDPSEDINCRCIMIIKII